MTEKNQKKTSVFDIFRFLSIDYLIHHKDAYKVINDKMSDSLFALSVNKPILWLIKDPESKYLVRQVAASMYNFMRFSVSFGVSSTDLVISKVINAFYPTNQQFSSLASKQRFYKRMMLTMRQNGGPYEELHHIISSTIGSSLPNSFLQKVPTFRALHSINKQYPIVKKNSKIQDPGFFSLLSNSFNTAISQTNNQKRKSNQQQNTQNQRHNKQKENQTHQEEPTMRLDELQKLFYQQTGTRINAVFSKLTRKAYKQNEFYIFNGELRTGERVSISILPKHVERMWKLNKLPFAIFRNILRIVPFLSTEKAIFDSIYSRLSIDLKEEAKARVNILQEYDVDFSRNASLIFRQSQRISLPIRVPAPIPHLCTSNILVTERIPTPLKGKIPTSVALNLSEAFADLLFKHEICVPRIYKRNILYGKEGIALSRYAPLTFISGDMLHSTIQLQHCITNQRLKDALYHADILGLSKKSIEKSIKLNIIEPSVFREFTRRHSDEVLSLAEAGVNIYALKEATGRQSVLMPEILGIAAKRASPRLNQSNFPYSLFGWTKFIPF